VATIKKELIGLMISVPATIQSQLGETISLIADSDFWTRWDTLIDVSWPPTRGSIKTCADRF
jgi:exportin-2 (importin alpha re-exporter)